MSPLSPIAMLPNSSDLAANGAASASQHAPSADSFAQTLDNVFAPAPPRQRPAPASGRLSKDPSPATPPTARGGAKNAPKNGTRPQRTPAEAHGRRAHHSAGPIMKLPASQLAGPVRLAPLAGRPTTAGAAAPIAVQDATAQVAPPPVSGRPRTAPSPKGAGVMAPTSSAGPERPAAKAAPSQQGHPAPSQDTGAALGAAAGQVAGEQSPVSPSNAAGATARTPAPGVRLRGSAVDAQRLPGHEAGMRRPAAAGNLPVSGPTSHQAPAGETARRAASAPSSPPQPAAAVPLMGPSADTPPSPTVLQTSQNGDAVPKGGARRPHSQPTRADGGAPPRAGGSGPAVTSQPASSPVAQDAGPAMAQTPTGAAAVRAPAPAAPAAPPASAGATQNDVPGVSSQLLTVLSPLRATADGRSTITIQLQPEGLGVVQATITQSPTQTLVHLVASTADGQAAIRSGLGDLRQGLSGGGHQADVLLTGNNTPGDGRSGNGPAHQPSAPRQPAPRTTAPVAAGLAALTSSAIAHSGALDISI